MAEEVVELCIKNPGKHGDFRMKAQAGTTLAEVQQLIQRDYDGNPEPKTQTLIYGGKVLKDTGLTLADVLPQPLGSSTPHNLHLVV
ncbi:MAG: hypothetical protein J3K34DRAFT_439138, partial [Monoraphidium minutum]